MAKKNKRTKAKKKKNTAKKKTSPSHRAAKKTVRRRSTIRRGGSANSKDQYFLNPDFEFFHELRTLILKASPAEKDKLIKKILGLGRVKLAIISGIFLTNDEGAVIDTAATDLFIVGDDIDRRKLNIFLKNLEAEVGKEIKFGIMEKEEFEYRFGMFDRFVRVLLEGPHEKIINRLGI